MPKDRKPKKHHKERLEPISSAERAELQAIMTEIDDEQAAQETETIRLLRSIDARLADIERHVSRNLVAPGQE